MDANVGKRNGFAVWKFYRAG